MTHFTLVRHGTTKWMELGLTHGRLDAPLSALGISQVQGAAAQLRGRHFDAFYSSPTGRAWQTAGIIGQAVGMSAEPLDSLMETDFGALEGKPMIQFPLGRMVLHTVFGWFFLVGKGSETLHQVSQRAARALEIMYGQHPGGRILVVSHSGLINMILRNITGRTFGYFAIQPASITEIEVGENGKGKILSQISSELLHRTK